MTSFRFLHAADLHLGSPFQGLAVKDPEIAARFAEATRKAFANLVARAIEERVAFVVIAGDVYDGEWKDNTVGLFFNREVARLDREGIPLFLLRGNHDADSVVTRSITLPPSVSQFETRRPTTFRIEHLKVALHGQGFAERAATENLSLGYPPPVAGHFNIGVLHTSLTGRPPHANYAPCGIEDLKGRGYDYWALGHVHEHEIVCTDPHVVFPGNLQGRSIRETGAKGAVIVSVEEGRVTSLEHAALDEARWALAEVDVAGAEDLSGLLGQVERALAPVAAEAEGRLLALRLRLTGETPMRRHLVANRASVGDEIQAACHRLHPDIWLEKLDMRLADPAGPRAPAADPALDLAAILEGLASDPEMIARARSVIAEVAGKLPAGLGALDAPLGDDAETLLAEARDVLLERAGGA
ncbi:metallophosphoesterase family protein [Lutibaculum baratangense]|uniref:DNA repair exonuclease family protein YhaO n=1 Tax=Lutibaculum baratangense AMV1 TaxID=631454 RepID=V4QS55_9HYPH|nr:DNA repair exonuclease [Lutibaculum baratangense]ESR22597.1 DNA repair exonuclease family protein YhaO [Lutibaculum baratangense AMV1]